MRRPLFALAATALLCAAAASPAHAAASPGPSPSSSPSDSTLIAPDSDSALLNLLGQQGVDYFPELSLDDALAFSGADTTLVIDSDEQPTADQLREIANGRFGRIILLNNDTSTLDALMPGVSIARYTDVLSTPIQPACNQLDAAAAGDVQFDDYSASFDIDPAAANGPTAVGCYPVNGAPTLVAKNTVSGDVIALGSVSLIDNDKLTEAGNAALALRLFGAGTNLVWYANDFVPDVTLNNCVGTGCNMGRNTPQPGTTTTTTAGSGSGSGSASGPTLTSLMPTWIWWALLQLLIAVLLTAYWRGRRLGAVVSERLPVTVRAAETVEGHARLYRRANAHGRAAELLRKAAAGRLAGYFGVPAARAHGDPALLVAPVAARLNVAETQVAELLAGGAPQSEAELVLLADHLDQLEQEVRSS
jgi:hypothetical protein